MRSLGLYSKSIPRHRSILPQRAALFEGVRLTQLQPQHQKGHKLNKISEQTQSSNASSKSLSEAKMLDGLIFQPPGTQTTQQTRQGVPIYGGGAQGFEEWQFKIEGRVKAIEAQCDPDDPESVRKMRNQLIKLSTDVVDALEDDSLRIAMEIGHENLSTVTGVTTLIQRIEESIP